ncbi:hypothetical protein CTRI78_v010740 [Colletotrichum trifolii]|uniref:Uncharacterized protein n=1 Tax=Colletotrichum trifolii TaxID=5466 RepID=A0A4R8QIU3_COLTR|nr:hypothetical protein CTRI78_v010740 [Colletotrichum trifolii]
MALALRNKREQRDGFIRTSRALGYDMVDGNLTFSGITRVHGARLRELCFPELIDDEEEREEAIAQGNRLLNNKAWFSAHSILYDWRIHHLQMKTLRGLRYDLCEMVKMGKCDRLGSKASAVERAFKEADYERRYHDEIFDLLGDPALEADWDLGLFSERYFSTDGWPDLDKQPDPLVLRGVDPVLYEDVANFAHLTMGLYMCDHMCDRGLEGTGFVVLGWDPDEVYALARDMESTMDDESWVDEFMRKALWKNAMYLHRDYLSSTAARLRLKEGSRMEPRSMRLDDAVGSYVVKCPFIKMGWPQYRTVFRLDIKDPPWREGDEGLLSAKMSFGVLEGVMLLSFCKKKLNMTSAYTRLDDTEDEFSEISDMDLIDDYDIDAPSEGIFIRRQPMSKTRKRLASDATKRKHKKRPRKNQKPVERQVMTGRRRLYFMWSGTELDVGEQVETHGYIDFNKTCTKFKGITWMKWLVGCDVPCKFEGFEVGRTSRQRCGNVGKNEGQRRRQPLRRVAADTESITGEVG